MHRAFRLLPPGSCRPAPAALPRTAIQSFCCCFRGLLLIVGCPCVRPPGGAGAQAPVPSAARAAAAAEKPLKPQHTTAEHTVLFTTHCSPGTVLFTTHCILELVGRCCDCFSLLRHSLSLLLLLVHTVFDSTGRQQLPLPLLSPEGLVTARSHDGSTSPGSSCAVGCISCCSSSSRQTRRCCSSVERLSSRRRLPAAAHTAAKKQFL